METQPFYRNTPRPEGHRLRKVMPEDDYVDYLHEQAQYTRRRPSWWWILAYGVLHLACCWAGVWIALKLLTGASPIQ